MQVNGTAADTTAHSSLRNGVADTASVASLLSELRRLGIELSLNGDNIRVSAPKDSLTADFRKRIAGRRTEIIGWLRAASEAAVLTPVDRKGALPVSTIQQRLWFLDQLDPGLTQYNIGNAVRCRGPLQQTALLRAIEQVVARHEAFRTRIVDAEGQPAAELLTVSRSTIEFCDLRGEPVETREERGQALVDATLRSAFDMAAGFLASFRLIALGASDHIVVFAMHHAVSDGWSLGIVLGEIWATYNANLAGHEPPLKALVLDYGDYAATEQARIQAGTFEADLDFWREELAGVPPVLDLPFDRPRPARLAYRGAHIDRYFDPVLIEALDRLAHKEDATRFMVMLAAWMVLLHRLSGQDDIVIGTPVADREHEALEGMVGCLVNNIPLRGRLGGNPRFSALLEQVRQTSISGFDHRQVPFDRLVEALNPPRSMSHAPIFQVFFALMSFPAQPVLPKGVMLDAVPAATGTTRFDLTVEAGVVQVGSHRGKLHARYEYDASLFDRDSVERLHDQYCNLLGEFVATPEICVDDARLLTPAKEREVLAEINATAADHDRSLCLHHLFEQAARAWPTRTALISGGTALTYAEFDSRSNALAHLLADRSLGPGKIVAVCLERTEWLPIALMAVLKAGSAYLPLDPSHPPQRLMDMIADSGAACVITSKDVASVLPVPGSHKIVLDDVIGILSTLPDSPLASEVTPADLAYVIYTSGSTGKPKGVEIEHRNVVAFMHAMRQAPGMSADDCLLSVTTISFDIAGLELWLPLGLGAKVVLARAEDALDAERLATLLDDHAVTVMQATPSTWRFMCEEGWQGKRDLRVLCGGEALPRDLAADLLERVQELWNMYGPTETTIWSTVARITSPEAISIGRPIANTRVFVLDRNGAIVPPGVAGELHIGGEGVGRGYHARPDLSANRFVTIPVGGEVERLYRTGDVVRLHSSGDLEWLARADNQVKVRGHRIELGEIEAALLARPEVREAVVVARDLAQGDSRLLAYLTEQEGVRFDEDAARMELRAHLPNYMMPSFFTVLPEMPYTPNRKIDRNALPLPQVPAASSVALDETSLTQDQRVVLGIWRTLLRTDKLTLHDNFFDVGGHSLLLMRLRSALKRELGRDLSLVEMFQRTTIIAQAEEPDASMSSQAVERARARAERQIHG